MTFDVLILAAGAGTRMCSATPKVLHSLAGKSLIKHVLDTVRFLQPARIGLIYGHEGQKLQQALPDQDICWILQTERLGTGHAVQQALSWLSENKNDEHGVLVLFADVPLISQQTLMQLTAPLHKHQVMRLLTADLPNPSGYGRIVRDGEGHVVAIVEDKDADENQKQITEVYSGIGFFKLKFLKQYLPRLTNQNQQQEFYLTELMEFASRADLGIATCLAQNLMEIQGINDRCQLIQVERYYQQQYAKQLMIKGATIMDPHRFDVRGDLQIDTDVSIDVNCIFEGTVKLGRGCSIGPNCYLKNAILGDNVIVQANTVIEGAKIGANAKLGPFARIRPDTQLADHVHIGNFVEVKKSVFGEGSKANHLAYIGDATIGEKVNIGAGTITCNYDSANKHQTVIEDEAFIGSNSSLVAPVKIGRGATIGAGSTINKDAPAEELTVARAKQQSIKGWKRPKKKKITSS